MTEPTSDRLRLRRFVSRILLLACLFAPIYGWVGWATGHPRVLLTGGMIVLFIGALLVVRRRVEQERLSSAALLVAWSLLAVTLVGGLLLPFAYPVLVLTSLMAVVAALPYVEGRPLALLSGAAFVCTTAVSLSGHFLVEVAGLPTWAEDVTVLVTLLACAYLIYLSLWLFSTRLRQMVRSEQALRAEAILQARRSDFLASAGEVLSASLDYRTTLSQVCALSVPALADWCTIVVANGDGQLERVAVKHVDPERAKWVERYERAFPPERHNDAVLDRVMQAGQSVLVAHVTDEMVRAIAQDPEHFELMTRLGVRSCMLVPMVINGRGAGVLSFMSSREERRFTEADLATAEELARRAAFAVENARLYAELQRAVAVRDDFLSIVSHETRTPIAALVLNLQLLQKTLSIEKAAASSEKLQARVDKIRDNIGRLEHLVQELLDVARITRDRIHFEPEELDLSKLVAEWCDRFSEEAARRGSRLELRLDRPLVGRWDRMGLEQVLSNLISNALKYGEGRPVRVETFQQSEQVVLRVSDQGIGIAPQDRERIFQQFERAVSHRQYGGLGLGLWITRQFIHANGGTIEVSSEPGKGTTFTVRLPRESPPPKETGKPRAQTSARWLGTAATLAGDPDHSPGRG